MSPTAKARSAPFETTVFTDRPMSNTSNLSNRSIGQLKQAFSASRSVGVNELSGFYRGEPAGPWWFRLNSGPTLAMTGFGGWLGKQFLGEGHAVNMFQRQGATQQHFPMTLARRHSLIDGKDTLVLLYPATARAPWCWVTDELRWASDGSILGMTFVDRPLMKQLVFPFVLKPCKG